MAIVSRDMVVKLIAYAVRMCVSVCVCTSVSVYHVRNTIRYSKQQQPNGDKSIKRHKLLLQTNIAPKVVHI